MRRFTRSGVSHPAYLALVELGKAVKTDLPLHGLFAQKSFKFASLFAQCPNFSHENLCIPLETNARQISIKCCNFV